MTKKYTKSHSTFVKRSPNTLLNDGSSIYEVDYSTIQGIHLPVGEDATYNEGNFKIITNDSSNESKKYNYGNWITSPSTDEYWTLEELSSNDNDNLPFKKLLKNKLKLNNDYNLLSSFSYYGSLIEMIKSSINDILNRFPASLWIRPNNIDGIKYNLINDYNIDLYTTPFSINNNEFIDNNNIKIMAYNYSDNYEIVETIYEYYILPCGSVEYKENSLTTNKYNILSFIQNSIFILSDGSLVKNPVDDQIWRPSGKYIRLIDNIIFNGINSNNEKVRIELEYVYSQDNPCELLNIYTNVDGETITSPSYPEKSYHIIPKPNIINEFWESLDDFQNIILNKQTNPRYSSIFKIPVETGEFGIKYMDKSFIWDTPDGWNLDISSNTYLEFINDIYTAAEYIDTTKSDNIFRMLTHETLKNVNNDIKDDELNTLNAQIKIENLLRLYGRVYDDIIKYIAGISHVNNITYDKKNNLPDSFLKDFLTSSSGWEITSLINDKNIDVMTDNLYFGYRNGFNINDVEIEFYKRLILSSPYIFKSKGTKKSVEYVMNLFGIDSNKWSLEEYVYQSNTLSKNEVDTIIDLNKSVIYTLNGMYYEDKLSIQGIEFENDVNNINDDLLKDLCISKYYLDSYVTCPTCNDLGVINDNSGKIICPTCNGFGKIKPYIGVPTFKGNSENLYYQQQGQWYQETSTNIKMVNSLEELLNINKILLYDDVIYYVDNIDLNIYDSSYFKLIDINNFNLIEGWENVVVDDIKNLINIEDTNLGNNPHYGNGSYDNGIDYLKHFSTNINGNSYLNAGLFKYALNNSPECIKESKQYKDLLNQGFIINKVLDTKKCWGVDLNNNILFNNNYNIIPNTWYQNCDDRTIIFNKDENIRKVNYIENLKFYNIINVKEVKLIFNGDINECEYFKNIILPYLEQVIPSTILLTLSVNKI